VLRRLELPATLRLDELHGVLQEGPAARVDEVLNLVRAYAARGSATAARTPAVRAALRYR
jgi:hypothetical protein